MAYLLRLPFLICFIHFICSNSLYSQNPHLLHNLRIGIGWQAYTVHDSHFEEIISSNSGFARSSGRRIRASQNLQLSIGYTPIRIQRYSLVLEGQLAAGTQVMNEYRNISNRVFNSPSDLEAKRSLLQVHAAALLMYELRPWYKISWTVGGGIGISYRYHEYRNKLEVTVDNDNQFIDLTETHRKEGNYSTAYLFSTQLAYPINEQLSISGQANLNFMKNKDYSVGLNLGLHIRI